MTKGVKINIMEHLRDSHRVNDNWSCLFLSDPIFIK